MIAAAEEFGWIVGWHAACCADHRYFCLLAVVKGPKRQVTGAGSKQF
jgi:hypothetical protein